MHTWKEFKGSKVSITNCLAFNLILKSVSKSQATLFAPNGFLQVLL